MTSTQDGTRTPRSAGEGTSRAGRRPAKPTIADVAALAGVSKAAVSKVVNHRGGISEPTRVRILEAAAKLGWSPSASATALRGQRTRTIGLVLNRSTDLLTFDPYFTELIAGLEQELGPLGYGLQLHLVGGDPVAETRVYERLARERRVDAVLLTESRVGDTRYDLVRRLHLPALLVGRPWNDDPVEHVRAGATEDGITAAVTHLLGLGHRRIAYLAGPDDRLHTVLRRRAVQDTLAGHGLAPHAVLTTDFTGQAAAEATRRLLTAPARPGAILYANDSMALAGMGTAQRLGVAIPEDVSVIGYDGLPFGQWVHPRLTTVSQDVRLVGRVVALRLLGRLGEVVAAPPAIPPPHLVVRDSTGPPPGGEG